MIRPVLASRFAELPLGVLNCERPFTAPSRWPSLLFLFVAMAWFPLARCERVVDNRGLHIRRNGNPWIGGFSGPKVGRSIERAGELRIDLHRAFQSHRSKGRPAWVGPSLVSLGALATTPPPSSSRRSPRSRRPRASRRKFMRTLGTTNGCHPGVRERARSHNYITSNRSLSRS